MSSNSKVFSTCFLFFIFITDSESFNERGPRMRIFTKQSESDTLNLPSNATSIRENIVDNFSCEERSYGYYADIENDCQIFHVCLPITFADGKNQTFRWSFICPEETVFDQGVFVCVRSEDTSVKCEESEEYYMLNDHFGEKEPEEDLSAGEMDNERKNSENNMENMDDKKNAEEDDMQRKKPSTMDMKSQMQEQKKKNERRKPKM